jgi:hypothetical protein
MAGRAFYLVTSLPPLPDLGGVPPLALDELADQVSARRGPADLVRTILLADDLLQRESFLAGETAAVQPAVLTAAQVRNEAPLPEFLAIETAEAGRRLASDAVWEAYWREVWAVARRRGSTFLREWTRSELALRNALATARAQALGLDPADYLVAPDLAGRLDDHAPTVSEWAAAPNPLEGLRVLDRTRWAWLVEHDQWFSFGDDEVAAYAAKLALLARWHRINAAEKRQSSAAGT